MKKKIHNSISIKKVMNPKVYIKGMIFAALFAALTAALSPIKIPLGFTPVPITLQTMMVLLSGAVLGPYFGALSQLLYIIVGGLGLPVFAGGASGIGVLMGPTGGYLLSYPLAAFSVGFLLERKNKILSVISTFIVGALILVAYIDLLFGIGIMKFGKASLVSMMSYSQRVIWVLGSFIVILAFIYLIFYLQKKKNLSADTIIAMLVGTIIIYIFGALQGKYVTGLGIGAVFVGWVLPFIIGDTVKLMVAASISQKIDIRKRLK